MKHILNLSILISLFFLSCTPGQNAKSGEDSHSSEIQKIVDRIEEPGFPENEFIITGFGAKADGLSDCKPAIDSAISTCNRKGGGKVIIPAGTWYSEGPVHLKSNINLHLEEGAELIFSQNPHSYLPLVKVRWEGTEIYNYSPLIYAHDAENIAITGKGKLNGNGTNGLFEWRYKQKPAQKIIRKMGRELLPLNERILGEGFFLRSSFIELLNCRNILISDLIIEDAPFWVIHPVYSKNITIRRVTINSSHLNNDGIDPDSSEDMLIENCLFNTGDDAIAFKSGRDEDGRKINKASKNIVVRNCKAGTTLHGLAFGSEMSGGLENIYIRNFKMQKVLSNAIQFKANKDRGAYIRNISVSGIQIDSTGNTLVFTNAYHGYTGGQFPSAFHNISISNLDCKYSQDKGFDMVGLPEKHIHNIRFKNIIIHKTENGNRIELCDSLTFSKVMVNETRIRTVEDI